MNPTLSQSRLREARDRYWRTYQRKLGEDFDLAGKALAATAGAAMFAPLASKGAIVSPNLPIGTILIAGLVAIGLEHPSAGQGETR